MDCKMIQDWIELEIDDLITDEQKLILDKHLIICDQCRSYQFEAKALHLQLLSQFDTIETELMTSTIMRRIKPRKKFALLVASLIVILSVTFNNQLYALVSDFPIVGEFLDFLSKDEGIDYANENGYPSHDMMFQEDGVIVIIKDFYLDKHGARYKYAVQIDGEFVMPEKFSMKSETYSFESYPSSYKYISVKNPWISSTLAPGIKALEENNSFDVSIVVDENEYILSDVEFIYEKVSYEVKYININQTIETPGGLIEFVKLEIHPGNMILHISSKIETNLYSFKIICDRDNVTEFNDIGFHMTDELTSEHMFRQSIYYDDVSEIAIEFNYNPPAHKAIGKVKFNTLKVDIEPEALILDCMKESGINENVSYTKYEIENILFTDESVTFDVISDREPSREVFPNLEIKKGDEFVLIESIKPSSEYDQYVKIPYYFLIEWFGENLTLLNFESNELLANIELHELLAREKYQHTFSKIYSLGKLKDLLDKYSIIPVDLDMYYMDKDIFISIEEINNVLATNFKERDFLFKELTYSKKVNLQMYFYEEYGVINDINHLLNGFIVGLNPGVKKTSENLILYNKTTYKVDKTDDTVEIYLQDHSFKEPYIIKVAIDNN